MRFKLSLLIGAGLFFTGIAAQAFCGFYVARAGTDLFNQASQVVLVRDGDRTVLTMANDYQGEASEFAIVIPVPTFLEREQIHVADAKLVEHLDAYTAPRLVEYHDPDPCRPMLYELESSADSMRQASPAQVRRDNSAKKQGVTIEASYTVGEYDILILSAKESSGLVDWLTDNEYKLPDGAERVVGSYLRQGMRFFVAKVNLKAQEQLGYGYLRPLQIAFESPKFMLPIRLGTLNAKGKQDLYVYALTRTGRVETSNYRTVRIPSDVNIPEYVEDEFGEFYQAMFKRAIERENDKAVMLEYAWDMNWCDPCAADPLSPAELRELGVFWTGDSNRRAPGKSAARDVFVTRLHVRYDADTFPDDLRFQETGDRSNFQGRYVIQKSWKGDLSCEAGKQYRANLAERQDVEAKQLANLTGWDYADIRKRLPAGPVVEKDSWWRRLWGDG